MPLGTAAGWTAAVPARRAAGGSSLRISCNLYSFNQPLRDGTMSLPEVLDFCAELGFDAVDPTGYYFPGYPTPPPEAYVYQIKRQAFLRGLDISGTGVRNDFTVPDAASRAADVDLVRRWLVTAEQLGAPTLRVFAGRADDEAITRAQMRAWVVEGLTACAALGSQHGIVINLQNHADFLRTAAEVEEILTRVDSDWLGLNLDIGSFPTDDPYEDIARVAPYAVTWQIKENVHIRDRAVPTDLSKIVQILRDIDYGGYIPIETLGPGDPREKVPRFLDRVREALA